MEVVAARCANRFTSSDVISQPYYGEYLLPADDLLTITKEDTRIPSTMTMVVFMPRNIATGNWHSAGGVALYSNT